MNTIADLMHHSLRSNREKLYSDPPTGQRILREHDAIFQAIRNHDPQVARNAMLEHINNIEKGLRKRINKYETGPALYVSPVAIDSFPVSCS
jgi:GntR family transcriptional repressor for pyruvate dehydrogenase complex